MIAAGAVRTEVYGHGFHHLVLKKGDGAPVRRIYLGGDGRAHPTPGTVAGDPTPKTDLALTLFALDPEPAAFVGRPCYHGWAHSPECNPLDWTIGRYSDRVVSSVAAVLTDLIEEQAHDVTVVGFSGGGVIAVLAAERTAADVGVVTLAAPLDVSAWTELHGYTPLLESLDPTDIDGWRPTRRAWHLSGSRDTEVPPASIERYRALSGPESTFSIIDGYDHTCCWSSGWEDLLRRIPWDGQSRPHQDMLSEEGVAVRDGSRDPG